MEDMQQHNSIAELLKDITEATPEQSPQFIFEEPQPKAATATIADEAGNNSNNKDTAQQKPPLTEKMIESSANGIIGFANVGQSMLFKAIIKGKKKRRLVNKFGDDAIEKLESLVDELQNYNDNKQRNVIVELRQFNADELRMLRIEKEFSEALDDLPFSDDEIEMIKEPIKEMIRVYGKIPTEWMLMIGITMIIGARIGQTAAL